MPFEGSDSPKSAPKHSLEDVPGLNLVDLMRMEYRMANGSEQPKANDLEQPKANDSEQPKANDSEQSKANGSEQPKANDSEQSKAHNLEQPKANDLKQPKANGSEQPALQPATHGSESAKVVNGDMDSSSSHLPIFEFDFPIVPVSPENRTLRAKTSAATSADTSVVNPESVRASAKAIRSATYRDSYVYFGTDEEKIFKVLGSMTENERKELKSVYSETFGITLEDELKREMSGSQLDKSMNLLNKKDGIADDAGFVHELITELNQLITGRTRDAIGRTLREKLSTMSSDDIKSLNQEYQDRYGKTAQTALFEQDRLDEKTKSAFGVYFKGADKINNQDAFKLGDAALENHDLDMFREAMVLASPEARRAFAEANGDKALVRAFLMSPSQLARDAAVVLVEGPWIALDTPQSLQNYHYAQDYMKYGKLSAITQVKDASGLIDDNEGAIESALKNMSEDERQLYSLGKVISESRITTQLSKDNVSAVEYFKGLNAAFKNAEIPPKF